MREECCEREASVLEAATSGRWEDALRRHARECEICADVALVAGMLAEQSVADLAEAPELRPEQAWWKAQLKARREAREKAMQPADLADKVAYSGGGLAAVAVLAALWPELKAWAEPLVAAPGQGLQANPLLTATLWLAAAFGAVSLLVAIGVGIYFAWSDR
jgi:hypothetical protein